MTRPGESGDRCRWITPPLVGCVCDRSAISSRSTKDRYLPDNALSQQHNEAGGSPDRETPARVASSPDNDGTGRHYRMAWVRQA
jgi:hypothetical protein